jgi:hypothetical protein
VLLHGTSPKEKVILADHPGSSLPSAGALLRRTDEWGILAVSRDTNLPSWGENIGGAARRVKKKDDAVKDVSVSYLYLFHLTRETHLKMDFSYSRQRPMALCFSRPISLRRQ